ncbi:hypothetical protein D3C71_332090 [compost metagenome]
MPIKVEMVGCTPAIWDEAIFCTDQLRFKPPRSSQTWLLSLTFATTSSMVSLLPRNSARSGTVTSGELTPLVMVRSMPNSVFICWLKVPLWLP